MNFIFWFAVEKENSREIQRWHISEIVVQWRCIEKCVGATKARTLGPNDWRSIRAGKESGRLSDTDMEWCWSKWKLKSIKMISSQQHRNNFSIERKHRQQSDAGMKHPVTKAAKHLVRRHERNACGMRLQRIPHKHQLMRRPHTRNQRDEIVGMRHRKPNAKHQVIILDGPKHQKPTEAKAMVWFLRHPRQLRNDARVGTRLRQMQHRRVWAWHRAWRQVWHQMHRMPRQCLRPADRHRLVTRRW